jgi:hypothetical protein
MRYAVLFVVLVACEQTEAVSPREAPRCLFSETLGDACAYVSSEGEPVCEAPDEVYDEGSARVCAWHCLDDGIDAVVSFERDAVGGWLVALSVSPGECYWPNEHESQMPEGSGW